MEQMASSPRIEQDTKQKRKCSGVTNGSCGQGGDRFELAPSTPSLSRHHTGMMLPGKVKDVEHQVR